MDEALERSMIETMRVEAKMTRSYYDALVEHGFSQLDALALTQTWLRAKWTRPPEARG